jgi:hypothetical protein
MDMIDASSLYLLGHVKIIIIFSKFTILISNDPINLLLSFALTRLQIYVFFHSIAV